MKANDKICYKVPIKNSKERDTYAKRQIAYLDGTPKILLAKFENNIQEIWIDQLKNQAISKLKQYNSNQKAYLNARTIIAACVKLGQRYGNFIINENMIFFNQNKEVFAWINPDILENHVKIYLPNTHEGQLAMIRSVVTYIKLWLKCDYSTLSEAKSMEELLDRFDQVYAQMSQSLKNQPPREFLLNRKKSQTLQSNEFLAKQVSHEENQLKHVKEQGTHQYNLLLTENKSNRDYKMEDSQSPKNSETNHNNPGKLLNKSLSNKFNTNSINQVKFNFNNPSFDTEKDQIKNKTTLSRNTDQELSDKNMEVVDHQYQHKTFNNVNLNNLKSPLNKSGGIVTDKNYFPNKTTNNKNKIVNFIRSNDQNPDSYGSNKIVLEEQKMVEIEEKRKKMKESLDGIGEELNDLFLSNVENDDNEEELKKIQEEFQNLLS